MNIGFQTRIYKNGSKDFEGETIFLHYRIHTFRLRQLKAYRLVCQVEPFIAMDGKRFIDDPKHPAFIICQNPGLPSESGVAFLHLKSMRLFAQWYLNQNKT